MNLFERIVELKVGDTDITGLDIAFEIEKDESPEPNPCHIDVYNLGPENRATLSKYQRVPLLLKAGYKGQVGIIFQGDMLRCSHIKEGPTWKTVLASGEGVLAMQTKRINKSYAKGTPIRTVVEDLAKQMNLSVGSCIDNFSELNETLSNSFVTLGNPMNDACRLLMGKQFKISVQNRSLQLRKKTEPLQKEAINLSPNTGLIASREIGTKGEFVIRSLLLADFSPGREIYIQSDAFNVFATIEAVRFIGANFGPDWEAEMKCRFVTQPS